ncbi:unnamed protein product [Tilletia controversa]|nr:unnamed protein product [Tilletia controversa]CAD6910022.1 unnamed protein product [Tilletia controversa]
MSDIANRTPASARGSRPAPAAAAASEAGHSDAHNDEIASAIRLYPGVIQSTWHTSTDSKTDFDVGEPTDDPNVIITRVTTITTTTTVTTFTSPRSIGGNERSRAIVPVSGSASASASMPGTPVASTPPSASASAVVASLRNALPHASTPTPLPSQGVNGNKAARTINGSRPRVSFALEADDSIDDSGAGVIDDAEREKEAEKEKEQEKDKEDEENGDGDVSMAVDASHESNGNGPTTRRRDDEDDQGNGGGGDPVAENREATGGSSNTAATSSSSSSSATTTSAAQNGASSTGTVSTRRGGRNSTAASASQAAASADTVMTDVNAGKVANTPERVVASPEGRGLLTRRRATEQSAVAVSSDSYSPVLSRVMRKARESAPASSSTTTTTAAELESGKNAQRSDASQASAATERDSLESGVRIVEETTRSGRVTARRSLAISGPSTPTSGSAMSTRQSARLLDGALAGSSSSPATDVDKADGSAKQVDIAAVAAQPTWRDKVFLTSGIYSDDFRAGKSRKRKRKKVNMERRRLAAEKRARLQQGSQGKSSEDKTSEAYDSDGSISSLSSLSDSDEEAFVPEDTALPLPEHYGFYLLVQDREFRLPYPIMQDASDMRARADAKKKPRPYQAIPTNRYVTRPKLAGELPVCQCVPPSPLPACEKALMGEGVGLAERGERERESGDEPGLQQLVRRGCGEDCINRQLQYVCDPRKCPCGEECSNLSLGKRPFPKLEVFNYGQRGFGLRTPIALSKDQFLGEYRGEVIDLFEAARRTRETYIKDGNYYFLDYDAQAGEVLDAGMKGSVIRFANHSCSPNCYVMKWTICGTDEQLTAEFQIGMYALRDIEAGEELTYDYGWSEFRPKAVSAEVTAPIKCLCGASTCTGTLGGKKGGPSELAKSGLGKAAKEKKEKALRQQKKAAPTVVAAVAAAAAAAAAAVAAASPAPASGVWAGATPVPGEAMSGVVMGSTVAGGTSGPAETGATAAAAAAGGAVGPAAPVPVSASAPSASASASAESDNTAPNNDVVMSNVVPETPSGSEKSATPTPTREKLPASKSSATVPALPSASSSSSKVTASSSSSSAQPTNDLPQMDTSPASSAPASSTEGPAGSRPTPPLRSTAAGAAGMGTGGGGRSTLVEVALPGRRRPVPVTIGSGPGSSMMGSPSTSGAGSGARAQSSSTGTDKRLASAATATAAGSSSPSVAGASSAKETTTTPAGAPGTPAAGGVTRAGTTRTPGGGGVGGAGTGGGGAGGGAGRVSTAVRTPTVVRAPSGNRSRG